MRWSDLLQALVIYVLNFYAGSEDEDRVVLKAAKMTRPF